MAVAIKIRYAHQALAGRKSLRVSSEENVPGIVRLNSKWASAPCAFSRLRKRNHLLAALAASTIASKRLLPRKSSFNSP